jgi:ssDNA-binding Zn-finger/Zn-ribbon topoisomerase 1
MKPHPRIRTTIKWGGAAVTVLLVVVWIGSGWCGQDDLVLWSNTELRDHSWASIVHGGFTTGRWREEPFAFYLDVAWDLPPREPWRLTLLPWWFRSKFAWQVAVPLWPVVACAAACTLGGWCMDGRAAARMRAHLCPKCNYDRAGLVKGAVCPECGA